MSPSSRLKVAAHVINHRHPLHTDPTLRDIYNQAASQDLYRALPGLKTDNGEIRLIGLQPGKVDDPLVCTVTVASLKSDPVPEYEALSYTWHDPIFSDAIGAVSVRLNDVLVFVLPNLGSALQNLRHEDRERVLWIDFLCIDQSNVHEVNEQVKQMGTVYSSASQVVIFLGPAEETSVQSLALLEELAKDLHLPEIFDGTNSSERFEKMNIFGNYLSHNWFKRIWTVQECVLAKSAILWCGRHCIPWKVLSNAISRVSTHMSCCELYVQDNPELFNVLGNMSLVPLHSPEMKQKFRDMSLPYLLNEFRRVEASDPRDHIFALMGLIDPSQRLFSPEYSLTVQQVYTSTVLNIINHSGNLEVFAYGDYSSHDPELPSWVPDYSRPSQKGWIADKLKLFSSAGKTRASIRMHSEREAVVKGVFLDTVHDVDPLPLHPRDGVTDQTSGRKLLNHVLCMQSMAKAWLADDDATIKAFWKCAVLGVLSTPEGDKWLMNDDDLASAEEAVQLLKGFCEQPDGSPISDFLAMLDQYKVWRYSLDFTGSMAMVKFFLTSQEGAQRSMGMGPPEVLPGDHIAVLAGGNTPFVLRKQDNGCVLEDGSESTCYELLGPAYVDGLMSGDAETGVIGKESGWEDIYLR